MKRFFVLGILMAGISMIASAQQDLHQGDKLTKSMELEFSPEAKEIDAFISWELVGDWDLFDYHFSQGDLSKKVYTIKASEYKDFADGAEGVTLYLQGKPKTAAGVYSLSMKVKEVSDELDFPKDMLNLDLSVNYILPPPVPLWKRLLVPIIVLLVLVAILLLVLNVASKFPRGMLQLGRDDISLKGKKQISLRKELSDLGITLEDGVDVVLDKKLFGSFQGPRVKSIQNCMLERDGMYLSNGSIILPDEEVHGLTDINGDEILIRFC